MPLNLIIFFVFGAVFVGSTLLVIALLFYVGRTRIKEIDKIAHGFEMPNDSIFFLVLRVPNYGRAFLWKWYARRIGLEGKIDHFDNHFRWPFIAAELLVLLIIILVIVMTLFDKYIGIE